MKRIIILALLWLFTLQALPQQKIRISGRLLNCTDLGLELSSSTGTGRFKDSIRVKPDGSFSYTTSAVKMPIRASLTNREQIQIPLFLAPGYDLQINADVKDNESIKKTLNYQGPGSKTNGYWKVLLTNFKPDTVKWFQKDQDAYIQHLLNVYNNHLLINQIFNSTNTEPFSGYFKQSLLIDKKYNMLIDVYTSYAYQKKYKWVQIENILSKLGIKSWLKGSNNPVNLSSAAFCYFVSQYPFLCDTYNAFPADSLLKKEGNYTMRLTSRLFKRNVYDYIVNQKMESTLNSVYKSSELEKLEPYLKKINDPELKKHLIMLAAKRKREALKLQAGMSSPPFNLTDTSGTMHSLSNFRGKVVYIDLWASWCGPCKEEIPYLRKVYEQYKDNPKIAFVSIASFDVQNRKRRYEIIKNDQMSWLQLEDTTNSFAKSYQATFIPRFILIDKLGNIVDCDAPRPSDTEKLLNILNREISK